jgi:YhcH/YjgK/YiaL family protein
MIISKFGATNNDVVLTPILKTIIDQVSSVDLDTIALGKYPVDGFDLDDVFFVVMEYDTAETSTVGPEFHKVYTDVQFLVKGEEQFGWATVSDEQLALLNLDFNYSAERDICFISTDAVDLRYMEMRLGEFYIFTPHTLHMPNLSIRTTVTVRKVVIKIKTALITNE